MEAAQCTVLAYESGDDQQTIIKKRRLLQLLAKAYDIRLQSLLCAEGTTDSRGQTTSLPDSAARRTAQAQRPAGSRQHGDTGNSNTTSSKHTGSHVRHGRPGLSDSNQTLPMLPSLPLPGPSAAHLQQQDDTQAEGMAPTLPILPQQRDTQAGLMLPPARRAPQVPTQVLPTQPLPSNGQVLPTQRIATASAQPLSDATTSTQPSASTAPASATPQLNGQIPEQQMLPPERACFLSLLSELRGDADRGPSHSVQHAGPFGPGTTIASALHNPLQPSSMAGGSAGLGSAGVRCGAQPASGSVAPAGGSDAVAPRRQASDSALRAVDSAADRTLVTSSTACGQQRTVSPQQHNVSPSRYLPLIPGPRPATTGPGSQEEQLSAQPHTASESDRLHQGTPNNESTHSQHPQTQPTSCGGASAQLPLLTAPGQHQATLGQRTAAGFPGRVAEQPGSLQMRPHTSLDPDMQFVPETLLEFGTTVPDTPLPQPQVAEPVEEAVVAPEGPPAGAGKVGTSTHCLAAQRKEHTSQHDSSGLHKQVARAPVPSPVVGQSDAAPEAGKVSSQAAPAEGRSSQPQPHNKHLRASLEDAIESSSQGSPSPVVIIQRTSKARRAAGRVTASSRKPTHPAQVAQATVEPAAVPATADHDARVLRPVNTAPQAQAATAERDKEQGKPQAGQAGPDGWRTRKRHTRTPSVSPQPENATVDEAAAQPTVRQGADITELLGAPDSNHTATGFSARPAKRRSKGGAGSGSSVGSRGSKGVQLQLLPASITVCLARTGSGVHGEGADADLDDIVASPEPPGWQRLQRQSGGSSRKASPEDSKAKKLPDLRAKHPVSPMAAGHSEAAHHDHPVAPVHGGSGSRTPQVLRRVSGGAGQVDVGDGFTSPESESPPAVVVAAVRQGILPPDTSPVEDNEDDFRTAPAPMPEPPVPSPLPSNALGAQLPSAKPISASDNAPDASVTTPHMPTLPITLSAPKQHIMPSLQQQQEAMLLHPSPCAAPEAQATPATRSGAVLDAAQAVAAHGAGSGNLPDAEDPTACIPDTPLSPNTTDTLVATDQGGPDQPAVSCQLSTVLDTVPLCADTNTHQPASSALQPAVQLCATSDVPADMAATHRNREPIGSGQLRLGDQQQCNADPSAEIPQAATAQVQHGRSVQPSPQAMIEPDGDQAAATALEPATTLLPRQLWEGSDPTAAGPLTTEAAALCRPTAAAVQPPATATNMQTDAAPCDSGVTTHPVQLPGAPCLLCASPCNRAVAALVPSAHSALDKPTHPSKASTCPTGNSDALGAQGTLTHYEAHVLTNPCCPAPTSSASQLGDIRPLQVALSPKAASLPLGSPLAVIQPHVCDAACMEGPVLRGCPMACASPRHATLHTPAPAAAASSSDTPAPLLLVLSAALHSPGRGKASDQQQLRMVMWVPGTGAAGGGQAGDACAGHGTWRLVHVLETLSTTVSVLACSDGTSLLGAGSDGRACIWNLRYHWVAGPDSDTADRNPASQPAARRSKAEVSGQRDLYVDECDCHRLPQATIAGQPVQDIVCLHGLPSQPHMVVGTSADGAMVVWDTMHRHCLIATYLLQPSDAATCLWPLPMDLHAAMASRGQPPVHARTHLRDSAGIVGMLVDGQTPVPLHRDLLALKGAARAALAPHSGGTPVPATFLPGAQPKTWPTGPRSGPAGMAWSGAAASDRAGKGSGGSDVTGAPGSAHTPVCFPLNQEALMERWSTGGGWSGGWDMGTGCTTGLHTRLLHAVPIDWQPQLLTVEQPLVMLTVQHQHDAGRLQPTQHSSVMHMHLVCTEHGPVEAAPTQLPGRVGSLALSQGRAVVVLQEGAGVVLVDLLTGAVGWALQMQAKSEPCAQQPTRRATKPSGSQQGACVSLQQETLPAAAADTAWAVPAPVFLSATSVCVPGREGVVFVQWCGHTQ